MGSSRKIRPKIEHYRENAPEFRDLEDLIRYKGTHRMRNEMQWIKEITVQTAAKSFSSRELKDNQENFLVKMQDLRFVNGFDDVDDLSMSEIQQLVFNLQDLHHHIELARLIEELLSF